MAPPPTTHDDELPPYAPALLASAKAKGFATRDILALTWPVVLGQIMANAVPLIDILMLGRLGTPTLAAVGYAAQFLTLVQASLLAVGSACVAMMARAIGAGDVPRARRAFGANLWLGLALTTVLTVVTVGFPHELLHLLAVREQVIDLAVPYFRLSLASSIPMAIALGYEHAFRAARDTLVPMVVTGVVALVKVACNYGLIFGGLGLPALGLAGAGVATIVSQLCAVALFVAMSRRSDHPAVRLRRADLRAARADLREAFQIAVPAVAERFVMNAALMAYFRFLGRYGVEAIAAYNVGVRILAFTWIPGVGLSVAAATLVGQALGAGHGELARRSGWEATRLGFGVALVLGTLFIALRVPMATLFTTDPAVVLALDPFILLLGIGLPFLVAHFTLAGALRGAGDTMTPLKSAALGNWVFRVPLGYLFAEVLHLPLFWVWSIMMIDHISRAVWLYCVFRGTRWQEHVGAELPGRAPVAA